MKTIAIKCSKCQAGLSYEFEEKDRKRIEGIVRTQIAVHSQTCNGKVERVEPGAVS